MEPTDDSPLRVYFDAATMTPESLSRMVGVPLEIVARTPDPGDPERVCLELRAA